ncbi:MAG: aspartate kinase [Planctomycetota bacterium]|nr:MAG: aspartate kinase [Planctomycetota bacterium]
MSQVRVLKFGGAALADGPGIERACSIVASQGGDRPIVVVSAHEGVTDLLEACARTAAAGVIDADRVRIRHRTLLAQLGLDGELVDRYLAQLRELLGEARRAGRILPAQLDLVLSFGERMSARIVARALQASGIPATPVDAFDLGFVTDSNYGRARPLAGIGRAVRDAVAQIPGVPVVTGFLAKDTRGNLTTLGRNGSDLTASVIAEAVGAAEIQFWKSVGGILTADPELVQGARVIDRLTYAEAAECAFHGARILHPASVAPALRARVSVRVCNVNAPDEPGTSLTLHEERTGPVAVASRRDVARIDLRIDAPERRGECVRQLFDALDGRGWTPGLISASGGGVSVVVEPGPGFTELLEHLGPAATATRGLAIVAVVGQGLGRVRSAGLRSLVLLDEAGVEVVGAFLGDRTESQAFLIEATCLATAVSALHDGLLAGAYGPSPSPSSFAGREGGD